MATREGGAKISSPAPANDGSFAEDVLRQAGKSDDEARRTGTIDRADDEVEGLFAPEQQTINSPVHKAVWDEGAPVHGFAPRPLQPSADVIRVQATMDHCVNIVRNHRNDGTLFNEHGKLSNDVLFGDLAQAGYWGMLIDPKYGGQGAPLRMFMPFLTRMAAHGEPTVAGLASIHGCIGAVDPIRTFGNDAQKEKYLPVLAAGKRISAFALTEPCAGSDLTALRTRAVLDGDSYVVNGEKLFISNAILGRTIGLVCMIKRADGVDKPAVLIVDLPDAESENFNLVKYDIRALRRTYNNGLHFHNFRVPAENLLVPPSGDGLTIAYHGLNYGRVALCANAAGVMRRILAGILPWAKFRRTYGEAIDTRELVRRRIARLAGLIVAADAQVAWCSGLLDDGYRGEAECVIAKIFGSEAQKEAAIELGMKTHGGRFFLRGHEIGDNLDDMLAPCIYEGEGEMLGMAFFKAIAKKHGMDFMLPLGNSMKALTKGQVVGGATGLAKAGLSYVRWVVGKTLECDPSQVVQGMHPRLQSHVNFALRSLQASGLEMSTTMIKHQVKLADRQCRIAELSARVQNAIVMLCTAMYANAKQDEFTRCAADIICQDLQRGLTGARPSDKYFRACSKLAGMVIDGSMWQLDGVDGAPVLRTYE